MKTGKLRNSINYLSVLWTESRGVRRKVLAVSLLGCLSVVMSLVFIWIIKSIIDMAVSPEHCISIGYIASLVGCLLLQLSIPAIRRRIEMAAVTEYSNNFRRRLLNHLLLSKWDGRRNIHTGDAINRMQKDVDVLAGLTCSVLPGLSAVVLQLAGAFIFLIVLNAKLAWVLVFIMPVALLTSKIYIKRTRRLTSEIRKDESGVQSFLQENLHHRTLLSTLVNSDMILDKFSVRQSELTGKIIRRSNISIFSNMAVTAGFMAGYAVTFLWSAYGLTTGLITFGMMTAFLQLVSQVQRPAVDLSQRVPAFINSAVSIERIGDITSLPAEDFTGPDLSREDPVGLRLSDVSYGYPDDGGRKVIEHLSHDFKPGSITGIIGPTGAGKTTLVRLLLGLVEPTSGRASAYCDGRGEYRIGAGIRNNTVYVPQGNTLMYGTIRENLLLGNPAATGEMMMEAIHTAAADFITELPKGIDTDCFEGGVGLSEGQAQRIAIARGLLKGGNVIILDEPTSALDESTERELMTRLMQNLPPSSTVIIVTHRPEVLEFCTDTLDLTTA